MTESGKEEYKTLDTVRVYQEVKVWTGKEDRSRILIITGYNDPLPIVTQHGFNHNSLVPTPISVMYSILSEALVNHIKAYPTDKRIIYLDYIRNY